MFTFFFRDCSDARWRNLRGSCDCQKKYLRLFNVFADVQQSTSLRRMYHILRAVNAIIKMQFTKNKNEKFSATLNIIKIHETLIQFYLNKTSSQLMGREFWVLVCNLASFSVVRERERKAMQDKETLIKTGGRRRRKTVVKMRSCNFLLIINNFHIIWVLSEKIASKKGNER